MDVVILGIVKVLIELSLNTASLKQQLGENFGYQYNIQSNVLSLPSSLLSRNRKDWSRCSALINILKDKAKLVYNFF